VAIAAFGSPVAEFVDQRVPLDAVWAGETTRWLAANLQSAASAHERAAVLLEALRRHVPADWIADPLVAEAARLLREGQNLTTLAPSSRQIRRRFTDSMGYGPKFYERICRLDRFTDLLATHPASTTIAELAAAAGYHDQAHLARDCTAFTGRTPGQLRQNP
jgi:AraC-like DNA-binding protein